MTKLDSNWAASDLADEGGHEELDQIRAFYREMGVGGWAARKIRVGEGVGQRLQGCFPPWVGRGPSAGYRVLLMTFPMARFKAVSGRAQAIMNSGLGDIGHGVNSFIFRPVALFPAAGMVGMRVLRVWGCRHSRSQ